MGNPSKLWIPAEKLDENVKRMAWLLFLEWWKGHFDQIGLEGTATKVVETAYTVCLETAKVIRQLEQPKTEAADVTPD